MSITALDCKRYGGRMTTRQKQKPITLKLEPCKEGVCSDDCWIPNRHYPFIGTLSVIPNIKYERMELLLIKIMFGPNNKRHEGLLYPKVRNPPGYKLYNSSQYGSEDWYRYWWWNGRVFPLARGDIVQETYRVIPKTTLTAEELLRITPESDAYFKPRSVNRNFVVVGDTGSALKLLPVSSVPKEPMRMLRIGLHNSRARAS